MIPSAMSIPRSASKGKGISEGDNVIRPRNRRLLSTRDDEQELLSSGTSTPGGSARNSRAASPIPAKYPSRREGRSPGGKSTGTGNGSSLGSARERYSENNSPNIGSGGSRAVDAESSFGGALSGWSVEGSWMSSWNTLQELASSVLGSVKDNTSESNHPRMGKKIRETRPGGKVPEKWGPSKPKDAGIGKGSTAEREAMVRAKKMTRVLEGRDEPAESMDTNGNFKRRTSNDEPRPGSSNEDDQALVYIHPVQKNDTLQGVMLRYNCKPDVFRKANRFWPNDSIQIRKVVVLPIDACSIKGRPCEPPDLIDPDRGIDLLAPTPGVEESPYTNGSNWPGVNGTSAERPDEADNPWVHVRWVLLDSSPNSKPVEIARMPRKTLGYFPPRRRKSQNTLSTISTPRASLDFPASTISQSLSNSLDSVTSTPSRILSTPSQLSSSLSLGSYFPPAPMTTSRSSSTRPRRESVGEAAERMGWMRGPGGVGTLNGKGIRRPGPANDGLNSWAKKHIPGLAIDSLPSTSILGAEQARFGFNGEELPSIAEGGFGDHRNTVPGTGNQGMGLENAAAVIEGWVRRLAVRAPGTPGGGGRDEPQADLIELVDGAGSDDGRGFELIPPSQRAKSAAPAGGTGREDSDSVVWGRASAGAYAKGGKGD